jgi:hypothetical protein
MGVFFTSSARGLGGDLKDQSRPSAGVHDSFDDKDEQQMSAEDAMGGEWPTDRRLN